jgi:O-antigen ligase
MFSAAVHTRIHFILSCLIAFLLPFKQIGPVQVVAFCIAALMLNWLLEGDFANKFRSMRHRFIFGVYIAFYLLHIAGLAWSRDKDSGLFDLQVKLSFFIFPWIFSTRPFTSPKLDRILSAFLLGCAAASVLLLLRATCYYFFRNENKFFYIELSYFMHPGYFSMYLNLGVIYLLCSLSRGSTQMTAGWKLLIPLFVVMIVLLSSKLGVISLFLTFFFWLCWMMVSRRKYLAGLGTLILFAGCMIGIVKFSPTISDRLRNAAHALSSDSSDKTNSESTAVRMLIWGSAREVIAEHPLFGSGTGDAKRVLMDKYKEEGITGAYHKNLNAHDAYLQILVSLGVAGLCFFLGMLLLPFIKAFKEGKELLVYFTLLLAINFVPESMLETQAGVMFYGFFSSLLLFSDRSSFGLQLPWTEEQQNRDLNVAIPAVDRIQ